ncbi:MAG: response regulator, partial [Burkholderiales bacterium]|nr:response regulator [Burkholderiales bacterium]
FSLLDCLTNTCRNQSLRAAKKQLDLVLHMSPDVPDWVIGDMGRLQQVVTNLVGNAIKFTSAGHVLVRVQLASHAPASSSNVHLVVEVMDTGIGIAKDKLKLIFDAFTQADTTTTRQFGGTGLGLSISRNLIRLMGGNLTADSTPNDGSNFRFTLPLQRDPAAHADATDLNAIQPGQTAWVVLAHSAHRQCLADALTALGLTVHSYPTPAHAPCAPSATPPDMVFADADLPLGALTPLVTQWADTTGHTVPCARVGNLLQESAQRDTDEPDVHAFVLVPLDVKELAACVAHLQTVRDTGSDNTAPNHAQPLSAPTGNLTRSDRFEDTDGPHTEATSATSTSSASAAPEPASPHEAAPPADTVQPGLVILVAEDNAVNQKLIQVILAHMGHRVTLAVNGLEAVQAVKGHQFDLILMDIQMPEMGGMEATAAIRAHETQAHPGRRTPIVALTANALKGDRETFLAAGMDGYVPKPIMLPQLKAEIERVTHT